MDGKRSNSVGVRKSNKARNSPRKNGRLAAFTPGGGEGEADWSSCDSDWLRTVVLAITSMGGAITFGLSRDMGAYSVTLMLDGDRKTLWFGSGSDMTDEMKTIAGQLELEGED